MIETDKRAKLAYVRDMLQQLKIVCGAMGASDLVYILDMVRLQAIDDIAQLEGEISKPSSSE